MSLSDPVLGDFIVLCFFPTCHLYLVFRYPDPPDDVKGSYAVGKLFGWPVLCWLLWLGCSVGDRLIPR